MPSTYTVPNSIEKMAVGENENTWGQRLDNAFDVIDQALDGYATVTLTGTTATLTVSTGELAQGRCRVIRFIGTISGTATVTLPIGISRMYWIANDTNQSLILTIGGSTNLTIVSSQMVPVFTDSSRSSVLSMLSWNGALSISSLTVNGNLSVTGTTNVQIANGTKFLASDTVSAPNLAATTSLTAASASVSGGLSAGSATISTSATVVGALSAGSLSSAGNVFGTGNVQAGGSLIAPAGSIGTIGSNIGNITTLNVSQVNGSGRIQTNDVVHGGTIESANNINGGTVNLSGNVNAANGNYSTNVYAADFIRQGVPIVTLIQNVASGIAPLSGAFNSGDWTVFVFGYTPGNRFQVAFGRGAKSHTEQIALPPGHSYGSAKLLASLNETPSGTVNLGHISVHVDGSGVVTALITDTSGNNLGASADWIGVSWLQNA